jgi:DNA-binding transcriptional ArsR family regulator
VSGDELHDRVFKALGDGRRRRMLDLLRKEPQTTGQLCDAFPELDRCTVMQHLDVLEAADLIIVRRQGRYRWNYLNSLPIKEIHDRWIGTYAANAVTLLSKLKRSLESEAPSLSERSFSTSGRPQRFHESIDTSCQ